MPSRTKQTLNTRDRDLFIRDKTTTAPDLNLLIVNTSLKMADRTHLLKPITRAGLVLIVLSLIQATSDDLRQQEGFTDVIGR